MYNADLVKGIVDSNFDYDYVDSTSFNLLIQDFLEDKYNGYMTEDSYDWDDDSTAYITTVIDSTSPSISIVEWKEEFLEDTWNQAIRSVAGIVIKDFNSPHYPLREFKSLTDSIFDSGGLSFDSTAYVEYEFYDSKYIDRVSIWTNGTENIYLSYSKNNIDWTYISGQADHSLNNGFLVEAASQSIAESNYWTLQAASGEADVGRFPIGNEVKYVRVHFLSSSTCYELIYQPFVEMQSVGFIDNGGINIDLEEGVITIYDALGNLRVKLGKLS